jgi:hypothetical protein
MQLIKQIDTNLQKSQYTVWKSFFRTKWVFPFILIVLMIAMLSLKLISDPDTGFHLKTGKWIIENQSFPQKDTYTYTVNNNDYIDLHWIFQTIIYFIFSIFSYEGLSIFVLLFSLLLLFLLLYRNKLNNIPLNITSITFLFGYLIIEPRLMLRPEMLTFIYISLMLIVLDLYYYFKKNILYLLPIIMLVWANTQGLFILGFALIGSYIISIWFKKKQFDKKFLLWSGLSIVVCFINPYFTKGFLFPFELFTRLDSSNIFKQHISEFKSFYSIGKYFAKDIVFIAFSACSFILYFVTIRKRTLHDFIILIIFFYLALSSIRNIALFAVIAIPILCSSINDLFFNIKEKKWFIKLRSIRFLIYLIACVFPVGIMLRLQTGAYYTSNNSFCKFGIGLDKYEQPVGASDFLIKNKLNGKIINSIGYGGWLSWSIPQPIFIDGRLEVMKEPLYQEITHSWNNGLNEMLVKYKPELILYNYLKYMAWTQQLNEMPDWRLIFLDGNVAIYAYKDYASNVTALNIKELPEKYKLSNDTSEQSIINILNLYQPNKFSRWLEGFYIKNDYSQDDLLNIASYCFQIKKYTVAERFFIENIRRTKAKNPFIYYALADIYKINGDDLKLGICLSKIKKLNKKNKRFSSS